MQNIKKIPTNAWSEKPLTSFFFFCEQLNNKKKLRKNYLSGIFFLICFLRTYMLIFNERGLEWKDNIPPFLKKKKRWETFNDDEFSSYAIFTYET